MDWFTVSKAGLAKIVKRNGPAFVIRELWSNAVDETVTRVDIEFRRIINAKKLWRLTVTDDSPDGFKNLSHAWTLFADSAKKSDPTKRGRFNLGEKLVLALAETATITTTTGTVVFDRKGRFTSKRKCRGRGSVFDGLFKFSDEDAAEIEKTVRQIIVPSVALFYNGVQLPRRESLESVPNETLPCEFADEKGNLHRTNRQTSVAVYEPLPGYPAYLYELGVPVCETGDKYDVDIGQKIPLTLDRENVPPSYLRLVRAIVLNLLHEWITPDDANQSWVREGSSDEVCSLGAIKSVIKARFGEKAVIFDPSDPEANKLAVSKGYTVVYGSMLNAQEWNNVRNAGALQPAGRVTPSPKPYGSGPPLKMIEDINWTKQQKAVLRYAGMLASHLLGHCIRVRFADEPKWPYTATYGPSGDLTLNWPKMSHMDSAQLDALLIHEFGHDFEKDHLSENYHKALCRLGAKLKALVLERPELFTKGAVHVQSP